MKILLMLLMSLVMVGCSTQDTNQLKIVEDEKSLIAERNEDTEGIIEMVDLLRWNLGHNMSVEYNRQANAFVLTVTSSDMLYDIRETVETSKDIYTWNILVDEHIELSANISKNLNDTEVMLIMTSPNDVKEHFIISQNGVLIYDIVGGSVK